MTEYERELLDICFNRPHDAKREINNDEVSLRSLLSAVIIQAVADYRELQELGREWVRENNDSVFSMREIEDFLQSEFCDSILSWLGFYKLSGHDLLMTANT